MSDQTTKDVLAALNVSRETIERLEAYHKLLKQWNPKINLVAKSTIEDSWSRHILDSAQIWPHIPQDAQRLTDIGSGAGFPGLVLAIIAAEKKPTLDITMIESDQRKSAFLRAVSRETGITPVILTERIEQAKPDAADVLTARALADLAKLLDFSGHLLREDGICLFLKGASHAKELATAADSYEFEAVKHRSATDSNAVLLRIEGIRTKT